MILKILFWFVYCTDCWLPWKHRDFSPLYDGQRELCSRSWGNVINASKWWYYIDIMTAIRGIVGFIGSRGRYILLSPRGVPRGDVTSSRAYKTHMPQILKQSLYLLHTVKRVQENICDLPVMGSSNLKIIIKLLNFGGLFTQSRSVLLLSGSLLIFLQKNSLNFRCSCCPQN